MTEVINSLYEHLKNEKIQGITKEENDKANKLIGDELKEQL